MDFPFIEFQLTNKLIEILIQHKDIENLMIEDDININIVNIDELVSKGCKKYELE